MNELIASFAGKHGVPAPLVAAIVQVESGANPWAWNPEPQYRYLWDVNRFAPFRTLSPAESASERPPQDFHCIAGDPDQEWWAQQASWGLMQVMGAVAREHGYREPYLPMLCRPEDGLDNGCKHLESLKRRFFAQWGWDGVISAYNAGSVRHERGEFVNQGYVVKVNRALNGASI